MQSIEDEIAMPPTIVLVSRIGEPSDAVMYRGRGVSGWSRRRKEALEFTSYEEAKTELANSLLAYPGTSIMMRIEDGDA